MTVAGQPRNFTGVPSVASLWNLAVAEFQRRLKETFAGRLLELTFWEIAARDPTGAFAGAHGIDLLIRDWVKPEEPIGAVDSTRLQLSSEFDRLLNRSSAEHLQ